MSRLRLVAAGLALVLSQFALADGPLYAKNLSPISGLFGLPSQRGAATGNGGEFNFALHTSVASHYVSRSSGDEQLNQDGETLRLALDVRYALADNWELQLELPWLDHSGGQLDSLIDNWHDFWGMSDGGRSKAPRDVLDYRYLGPSGFFLLEDDVSGIGDTTLSLNHAFYREGSSVLSLALGYKFGTGDEEEFLGSGEDDAFLALRFSGGHLGDWPLAWHGQLGYLYAGESELLGEAQEQDLWFAGLSVDWAVLESLSLVAQVDAHAAPMDSDLKALGREAIMLTLGGRWRFARRWSLDLSVVEDVQVETAPDVTFQASVRYRP